MQHNSLVGVSLLAMVATRSLAKLINSRAPILSSKAHACLP